MWTLTPKHRIAAIACVRGTGTFFFDDALFDAFLMGFLAAMLFVTSK
jgi:hypothetical protein